MKFNELRQWVDTQLVAVIVDPLQLQTERTLLLTHYLQMPLETLLVVDDIETETTQWAALQHALHKRIHDRIPIQYLLGTASFYGLSFEVSADVLIPRPETERLVAQALSLIETHSFQTLIDVGTGSGCIAIAIAANCPTPLQVLAIDKSPQALVVAKANAQRHQQEAITFIEGEWLNPITPERFPCIDLIVSNPPYIEPDRRSTLSPEVLKEPAMALFHPTPVETVYAVLLEQAQTLLRPGGFCLFELDPEQAQPVLEKALHLGFQATCLHDWSGFTRFIQARRPVEKN